MLGEACVHPKEKRGPASASSQEDDILKRLTEAARIEKCLLLLWHQPPTAHRRYDYALGVFAWRLNGRAVHSRRGRKFAIQKARS